MRGDRSVWCPVNYTYWGVSAFSVMDNHVSGFDVVAVFMTNWDLTNEKGQCVTEYDFHDASYACDKLKIPLIRKSYVKSYWNNVFRSS